MDADKVLKVLRSHRSAGVKADMGPRYRIHAASAIGVAIADMKAVA